MTGRNDHRIGNGQIAELANDWDGYAGEIPNSSAVGAEYNLLIVMRTKIRSERRCPWAL